MGVGGDWGGSTPDAAAGGAFAERLTRSAGRLADGRERDVRVEIARVIQEEVQRLGEAVEREEGRFERGEWAQSVSWNERKR